MIPTGDAPEEGPVVEPPASPDPGSPEPTPPVTVVQNEWGRVDAAGSVFVRTDDGEHQVGSWQVGEPEQALAFFGRKYDDLAVQVDLLEQRLGSGAAAPDETASGVRKLREALAESTDWAATARRYRELMARWKAAGPAPKPADDALWKRFRAAQDTFFTARTADLSKRDTEQQTNLDAKQELLAEAEALLPVTDWKAARETLRSIHDRWEAAGHVPRDAMRSIEGRLRRVEDAVRDAEQSEWRRTNPEALARAEATVAQLRSSIADLEKQAAAARERDDPPKLKEAEDALAARRSWLEQAERALDEFGGG
jgi:hypothetical protein